MIDIYIYGWIGCHCAQNKRCDEIGDCLHFRVVVSSIRNVESKQVLPYQCRMMEWDKEALFVFFFRVRANTETPEDTQRQLFFSFCC